jgi:hypothetical protein
MPSGITSGALIINTLRGIGAIATGETPTADESNDGLVMLNDLLELWSTQNLAVYGSADVSFPTVAAQAMYTIGPTGNWVGDRPVRINDNPFCTVGGVDFPIDLIGQQDYDLIGLKTQPGQIVERMLYVNDSPNGRITLWPTPNSVVQITMNIDRLLASVANLVTVMTFPPGYMLAFKHALGIMMAPDYGIPISQEWAAVATTSLASIKRANKVRRTAKFDAGICDGGPVDYQRGY